MKIEVKVGVKKIDAMFFVIQILNFICSLKLGLLSMSLS